MSEEYLHTIGRMEKEITPIDMPAGTASIAISMKRIADQMEETNRLLSVIAKNLTQVTKEKDNG